MFILYVGSLYLLLCVIRTVTITGSPMAANTAHYLILQRLAQVPGAPLTSAPQPKADHLNVQL